MNTFVKPYLASVAAAAMLIASGCSTSTDSATAGKADAKTEPAGPPEPVTAKTAFWPMYASARTLSTDFVTLKLASKDLAGFKSEAGKAPIWEATLASPSRHEYRLYSYAIAAAPPDIYKGVAVGRPMPWSGITSDAKPIQLSELQVDSDTAYKTASADAAAWLKKNPDKKLANFELWNSEKNAVPTWFLKWGDKKSGYIAYVNATNGQILKHK